jgi:hypothetical protein
MANTSLIGLTLPTTGTLSGTWGDTVNNAISQIIDVAVAGTQTISTDADITLTLTTGTSASTGLTGNSSQYAVILWTAAGTVTRTITVPAQSKTYVVINKSSTQSITVQGVTGTGVTVTAGTRAIIAWDGTNFVNVGGGTAGGSNTQVQYNSSGVFAGSANFTFNGTTATVNTLNLTNALGIGYGGTGQVTAGAAFNALSPITTTGDLILGNGTNSATRLGIGTSGYVLTAGATTASWQPASGAVASGAIYTNTTTISSNYTISSGNNGFSVGPITISSSYAVTVATGQRWVIL